MQCHLICSLASRIALLPMGPVRSLLVWLTINIYHRPICTAIQESWVGDHTLPSCLCQVLKARQICAHGLCWRQQYVYLSLSPHVWLFELVQEAYDARPASCPHSVRVKCTMDLLLIVLPGDQLLAVCRCWPMLIRIERHRTPCPACRARSVKEPDVPGACKGTQPCL